MPHTKSNQAGARDYYQDEIVRRRSIIFCTELLELPSEEEYRELVRPQDCHSRSP